MRLISRQGGRWRWAWLLAALLLSFHTLIAFGLPPSVPIVGTLVLGVVYAVAGALNGLLIASSLAFGTLLYAGALVLMDWEQAVYYRPLERLASFDYRHGHRIYQPGTQLQMHIRHGDLQPQTPADIAQPHTVHVQTDARGFRNETDHAGEPWLLVGDSFIAGVNNTQADLLGESLRAQHGIETHHLAFPGDVDDYLAYIKGFRADHGDSASVVLFLFEGNDFPPLGEYRGQRADPLLRRLYKRWFGLFSDTGVYRFTGSVYKRWRNRRAVQAGEQVHLVDLAGAPMALYQPYVDVSRDTSHEADPRFTERLQELLRLSARVFLIPTKYRVHQPLLEPGKPLPHARWDYLAAQCERARAVCEDLTPVLADAARRPGTGIWWRDDTHWNGAGVEVVAARVAAVLSRRP